MSGTRRYCGKLPFTMSCVTEVHKFNFQIHELCTIDKRIHSGCTNLCSVVSRVWMRLNYHRKNPSISHILHLDLPVFGKRLNDI